MLGVEFAGTSLRDHQFSSVLSICSRKPCWTKQSLFDLGRKHVSITWGYLRLCLNGHAPIERDGVEGVREAVLHVLLEIDAASGAGAFVVATRATDVTSRSS